MGERASEEFDVNIGLRHGSVLGPLPFMAVLDLINRKTVMKDAMKKLLYADDLALVANVKQELQDSFEEWNGLFTIHGLNIKKKREDGSAVHRPPEGIARHLAGGEETDSGGQFRVPRRGSVRRRDDEEREACRRAQAGENAWRAVGGGGDGGPMDLKKTKG